MSLRGHHRSAVAEVRTVSLLAFRLGKHFYALLSQGVRGVFTPEEAGSVQTVVAVGQAYHDVRLAERLALTRDSMQPDMRIVLYSNGQLHGAIQVDAVIGMLDVERKLCSPLPPQFEGAERDWILGAMPFQDQVLLILNGEWVLKGSDEGLPMDNDGLTQNQDHDKLACGA